MEEKKTLNKINDIKTLNEETKTIKSCSNKNEVLRLYQINDKLLNIVEKELKKETVPSKEILDTITTTLTITAALPWSKYSI